MQARRTQAERTAATRAALLQATVDALVETGYRRTTTQAIAKRAGTSYGALMHHFPTKADLLCAAVGHLLEARVIEFRKAMAEVPAQTRTADAAIDVLWSMFNSPTFLAWHELWVAARTDPELADAVRPLDQQFMDGSVEIFRELFAEESRENPDLPRLAIGLTYSFLDGLALSHLIPGHAPTDADELLAVFKLLITTAMPAPEEKP